MFMIGNDWDIVLKDVFKTQQYKELINRVELEYINNIVYPKKGDIYRALKLTPYNKVKVVIIGQDPYHGENEADGLAFSVSKVTKLPPSLKNIYKELNNDLNLEVSSNGDLSCWAAEGVLLLNSVLTVKKDTPASHKNIGWEYFTDFIIEKLNQKEESIAFILWGNFARSKKELITNSKHLVIESVHPSPLSASRGFFGSKPFSKTNNFLTNNGIKPIDFQIKRVK